MLGSENIHRLAASSMASGSPSSLGGDLGDRGALSAVMRSPGERPRLARRRAPLPRMTARLSDPRRLRVRHGQRWNWVLLLAGDMQWNRLVARTVRLALHRGDERSQRRLDDLLGDCRGPGGFAGRGGGPPACRGCRGRAPRGPSRDWAITEGTRLGSEDGAEVGKEHSVGETVEEIGRHFQGQAGLAGATWSGDSERVGFSTTVLVTSAVALMLAADKRGALCREVGGWAPRCGSPGTRRGGRR